MCEKSPENQNGAENTNRENRRIASLVVWPFVGAQFSTFWDSNTLQWWWSWNETCLSARKTYFYRKKICPQACRVHGFPAGLVLFNLVSMFLIFHLSFEIRETLYFIAFIPLRSLLLRSGNHLISCFSTRAEIPFRLHGIFSDFSIRLPGLKILARLLKQILMKSNWRLHEEGFSPGWKS